MNKYIILFFLFLSSLGFTQQTEYVDFLKADVQLDFKSDSLKVFGIVEYSFKILKDSDSIYIDAIDMKFDHVSLNEKHIKNYISNSKKIIIKSKFKEDSVYSLRFSYEAYPKKAIYFLKQNEYWNIWTQGQGKYTSNWLPSFDDVNEKVEFDLSVTFNEEYAVLANGKLDSVSNSKGYKTWHYNMQNPMSSYLVALAVGKYDRKLEISKSGIPLEMYYYPEDSLKVEPTYRYTKRMFNFLEDEIGFDYPWQNYKQVPVHDFLYAGMENTSLTIFSDAFVVDSIGFNDKNYVNVNAHELSHQWFGDLVTAKSGEHHWLQEGFATYYALLVERGIFGDDYFYFKLYLSAQDLGRQDASGSGTSLLNPKSSSLTFYQRGAWVLCALRNRVGDTVFREAVKNYLEKNKFNSVETADFIKEVEVLAEQDLTDFVDKWIVQEEFPFDDAIVLLKRQSFYIQEYIMVDCEAKTSKCKDYLRYDVSDDAKVKVIAQAPELVNEDVFRSSLKVRQAISQYVSKIPKDLKTEYESLLTDKSYLTVESALYNLWVNFPEERSKYLAKTKNITGFSDMNVRLLWLVLNLNTPEYQSDKKEDVFKELISYTNKSYNADLRMNAFQYLDLLNACNADCKNNLEESKSHHNWRLVKFAKQLSDQLIQKEN